MLLYIIFIFSFFEMSNGMAHSCQMTNVKMGCITGVVQGMVMSCDGYDKLDRMPDSTNLDPKYLVLSNFKFTRLQMFNFTKFKTVECMSIVGATQLSKIDVDAFSQMKELKNLMITNTNISDVDFLHGTHKVTAIYFENNKNLEKIDIYGERRINLESLKDVNLQKNNINYVSPEFLRSIENVNKFDLSKNKLKNLDFKMIATEHDQLFSLNLNDNLFQTINVSSKVLFQRLKTLKLGNNPFHCNCNLKWLKTIYRQKDKIRDYSSMHCASPSYKKLMDEKLFYCSSPQKPEINTIKVEGGYHVNCSSYGEPSPAIELTMFDGQKVLVPPSNDLSKTKTVTPYIFSSTGGKVKCDAVNSKGRSRLPYDAAPILSGGATIHATLVSLVIMFSSVLLL